MINPKLKTKYPQFKRRHGKQSSYHCVGVKVLNGAIKLPKLKPIVAHIHRAIIGIVKSITVSMSKTGKYYASILEDKGVDVPSPIRTVSKETGIDLGLSHFSIESNSRKIANPRFVKGTEKNLRRKQRQLSRKVKGTANRAKTRRLVAQCHEKVVNARADFQHKCSRTLVH